MNWWQWIFTISASVVWLKLLSERYSYGFERLIKHPNTIELQYSFKLKGLPFCRWKRAAFRSECKSVVYSYPHPDCPITGDRQHYSDWTWFDTRTRSQLGWQHGMELTDLMQMEKIFPHRVVDISDERALMESGS